MSSVMPSPVPASPEAAVAARRPPPQRRARGRDRARPVALPRPHRRPPDRPAAPRPPLRHAAEPRAAAGRAASSSSSSSPTTRRSPTATAPAALPDDVDGLVADYLAVGIDPDAGDDLRPQPGRGAEPAARAVPEPGQRRRARAATRPSRTRSRAAGRAAMSGAHVHLSRPPGRRHPVLQGHPRPRRPRPAAPPRARPAHRPALQRPLRAGAPFFPEPEALLGDGAAAARHGRAEDEQEPRQRHRHRRDRRRDGPADPRAPRPTPSARSPTSPSAGPEVSNLVLLAALCLDERPRPSRRRSAARAPARSSALVTEAVNERFRAVRARRAELARRPRPTCAACCATGNGARGRSPTTRWRRSARLMHTDYGT